MHCFRISKKTKVLAQATISPKITINNCHLKVLEQFIYLWSTTSSKLSLDRKLVRRIVMSVSTLDHLGTHVWKNPRLSFKAKVTTYNACVVTFIRKRMLPKSTVLSSLYFTYVLTAEATWDILEEQNISSWECTI